MQPILLTGLPRSGTTWASRAIVAATKGRVVHEPFNWKRYPERIDYHMKYLPAGSMDAELVKILRKEMRTWIPFLRNRRVIIKDVHICLAVEYLWDELNSLVIILVRHPCAMASSWVKLGLEARSRLDILLSQEELVRTYLDPFMHHIHSSDDYFFQIGAYWGAAHFVMHRLTEKHASWQWVTHEALCVDPFIRFEQLLKNIGVDIGRKGRNSLHRFLSKHNRARGQGEGPYSLARISANEPKKWQLDLTVEQIQAVENGALPFGVFEMLYNV